MNLAQRVIKQTFDYIFSLILLVVLLPFIFIILLIVFIITKQNPIIVQPRRLTLTSKKIEMVKIRTLRRVKHEVDTLTSPKQVLIRRDLQMYVPPFCAWLRRSGFDEITQLVNVLKGEMSLVGPRPLLIEDLQVMKKDEPEVYKRREKIVSKPGITGCWQIYGNREKGLEGVVIFDEYYEKEKSFFFDLKLILYTFINSLVAKHSDSIMEGHIFAPPKLPLV
jgi:lipopolysaccharide/colanic/teichoic acid biosynthesis glycosyltransferase